MGDARGGGLQPVEQIPFVDMGFFAGSQRLHQSHRRGGAARRLARRAGRLRERLQVQALPENRIHLHHLIPEFTGNRQFQPPLLSGTDAKPALKDQAVFGAAIGHTDHAVRARFDEQVLPRDHRIGKVGNHQPVVTVEVQMGERFRFPGLSVANFRAAAQRHRGQRTPILENSHKEIRGIRLLGHSSPTGLRKEYDQSRPSDTRRENRIRGG